MKVVSVLAYPNVVLRDTFSKRIGITEVCIMDMTAKNYPMHHCQLFKSKMI